MIYQVHKYILRYWALILIPFFLISYYIKEKWIDNPNKFRISIKSTELYNSLLSADPKVRIYAINGIIETQNKDFIPQLRALLLNDPSAEVRGMSALALGILKDTESGMLIINRLIQDEAIPKNLLLEAISNLNDPSIAIHVLPVLEDDNEIYRLQAVNVLEKLEAYHISKELLTIAKKNKDPDKLRTYIMALAKLKVTEAEPFLLELSGKLKPSIHLANVYTALGKIKSKKSIPILTGAIIREDKKCRENAVNALINIGNEAYNDSLISYLFHSDREIRFLSAKVLANIKKESISKKLYSLLDKKDKNIYGPISYILGEHSYKPSATKIQQLFLDTSNKDREFMAISLGKLKKPESLPILINSLKKESAEIQYNSAIALGLLGMQEAVDALMETANSEDKKLAILSIQSLGQLGSDKSLDFLVLKTKKNPDLAYNILHSIAASGSNRAFSILYEHLFSQKKDIQKAAISALGDIRDKKAISTLIQLLKSKDSEIIQAAIQSLKKTTGEDYKNPKEWIDRYKE